MPVYVTRPRLPDFENLQRYLRQTYDNHQLTNGGPLVQRLTERLEQYLGVKNLVLVSSGTIALQLALKLVGVKTGEVVTTPFSFPATSSAIVWHGATPNFVDIDPGTLNMNPDLIEARICENTQAIMPTHVFGNPAGLEAVTKIAKKHDVPLIFDAAQAFGVDIDGNSVLAQGDVSILSFHATKLFHTLEGGALVLRDEAMVAEAQRMLNFGLDGNGGVVSVGINGKMNEFEAAMGLAVFDELDDITESLNKRSRQYDVELSDVLIRPQHHTRASRNHGYYPVLFQSEDLLLKAMERLEKDDIYPRRYFYPSLDTVDAFESNGFCEVSQDVVTRILCLPIYSTLAADDVTRICKVVNSIVER